MTSIAFIAVLFFAARLAIRIGIVLLIIWGVIRLVDRWRKPVAAPAAPAAATPAPVAVATAPVAAPIEAETTDASDTKEVR